MASYSIAEKVNRYIADNKVVIFSKSWCPYCVQVKDVFRKLGVEFFGLELDHEDDGGDMQSELYNKTGQRTVPNVFVNGQHVGGCDDTKEAQASGKLQQLLSMETAVQKV